MFRSAVATLPAQNIERAKAFYRDTLGFAVAQEDQDGSVRFAVGETMLMVYPSQFAGTNQATAAGLGVDDVSAVVAELRGKGVRFEDYDLGEIKTVDGIVTMPDGSRGAWFKDPEGNIIGIFDGE